MLSWAAAVLLLFPQGAAVQRFLWSSCGMQWSYSFFHATVVLRYSWPTILPSSLAHSLLRVLLKFTEKTYNSGMKNSKIQTGVVAQTLEHLFCKYKAQSSNPKSTKKNWSFNF
jgi:hypothetical protein